MTSAARLQPVPSAAPMKLPTFTVMDVTPEMAADWLTQNLRNRSLQPRVVARYVRDMKAGKWQLNGEAIKFADDGQLLDGQHRLTAIVESGVTVSMLVVTNLAPESQVVMDTGKIRTGADAMMLQGEKNRSNLSSTIRLSILYLGGDLTHRGTKRQVSNSELIDFLEAHPEIRIYVDLAMSFYRRITIPPTAMATAMWVLGQIDREQTEALFEDMASLVGLEPGDPVLALHSRITDILRTRRRVESTEYLSMIFRTWNARREGRKLKTLPLESRQGIVSMPTPK